METLSDGKPHDFWTDEDLDEIPRENLPPRMLIEGINLKDLCDGKEIMFEITGDSGEDVSDDGVSHEIVHWDTKSLREKRGAPLLNTSFREIASKMVDVTDDGLVKKQVVTNGAGKIVTDDAYVTVHYNLYKESCELPFDSTYLRNHPEKFRLNQGEVILGLESAIKSMKKNENSIFFIKWEVAFGALGCPDRIEKKCDIVADVTLLNFVEVDPEYDLLSGAEKSQKDFNKFLNKAKQFLCSGSDDFSKKNAKAAVISYRKALKILDSLNLANDIQENQMLKEKLKCLVNLAVCYNKLGRPEQACIVCQQALAIDSNSVKANFHYGRANIALSNFLVARRCLLRADKLKPNDKEINEELKRLNDKKALYELKDKLFWMKAFEGEEKEKNAKEEVNSPLTSFEKNLRVSLEECVKEDKRHILPLPLLDSELKMCEMVAEEMKIEMEMQPNFCIFKPPKK